MIFALSSDDPVNQVTPSCSILLIKLSDAIGSNEGETGPAASVADKVKNKPALLLLETEPEEILAVIDFAPAEPRPN